MNNIFLKNIEALKLKNTTLAEKLRNYVLTDIPQLTAENNIYNLIYKNKPIHNPQNPLGEALEIFSLAENTPVAIHLIYGLGLGYLFQVASKNSKGTVILYEPDLNVMWLAFTLVDFSDDILKNNVHIADTYEDVAEAIYQKSGMKNSPQLISIPSQKEFNPNMFNELVQKLQMTIGTYSLDLKFTKQKFCSSLIMLLQNSKNLLKETPLIQLKDRFKGKTAVIVSAGPTLDRNIEIIKKNRDKFLLFVVGTAVKTIAKHNIIPDFVVQIEMYNSTKHFTNIDLTETNLITEPYSNPNLRNLPFKSFFSHISANSPINQYWSSICGENIEEYWTKGTVSYTAINSARILGCSKIILVGQDLAYIDGQCYSKESAYKDLYCGINPETNRWEIMAKDFERFAEVISHHEDVELKREIAKKRLKNLNNSLHIVKGIQGNMLPTESVYAAFIEPLTEYSQNFNDRKYINTSLVGAQIDGFENLDLETALKDSEQITNKDFSVEFKYPVDRIQTAFKNQLLELEEAKMLINENLKNIRNLDNELKRYKNAGIEVLKALKKVSVGYLYLSSDFSNKSKIFDFITVASKIDLDYEMKMTQNFTYESVKNINDKISKYLNVADSRVRKIENLIKEVLNESFNTES